MMAVTTNYTPPRIIKILSDDNEIEFIKTIPKTKSKEEMYVYRFIKSETKLGKDVEFLKDYLLRQLSNYFKII